MSFFADLHIHSKYARATSRHADLEHMALWASKKGISVIGTGDFTHPAWLAEIKEKLVPAEPGLFRLRDDLQKEIDTQLPSSCRYSTRFLLEVEISTIYKKGEKTRKVHHLLYVPDLTAADRLVAQLGRIGNLQADGRPILGLDSRDLLEITLECGEDTYLIPAHIWTPWFAALGSKSGFDSIESCYGDLTPHIFALETGLSSDPAMNWQVSSLDHYQFVSNSDAHSPPKIGREACLFHCEMDYFSIKKALETGKHYGGTIEFFPEEGKYHLDGHRKCGVCLSPQESKKEGGLCPVCKKPLTLGVLHRVSELADRLPRDKPKSTTPYQNFVTLPEIISEIEKVGVASKKVQAHYAEIIAKLGSEMAILGTLPAQEIEQASSSLLAEGITRMREERVFRNAGYDGEYGTIRLFTDDELVRRKGISLLFDLPPVEKPKKSRQVESSQQASENVAKVAEPAPSYPVEKENHQIGSSPCPSIHALDSTQQKAAQHIHGPLSILAGPGTGKTRTLTHRIAHLINEHSIPSEHCLALTFTKHAAAEMEERLRQLLPKKQQLPMVTTFHGLGYHILQENLKELGFTFRLVEENERNNLLKQLFSLSTKQAKQLLKKISQYKCTLDTTTSSSELIEKFHIYDKELRTRGWGDYDDLIRLPFILLKEKEALRMHYRERYRWISIDEFQDIDPLQYQFIKLLISEEENICIIGDPDQSIYGFRNSDAHLFQTFAEDYPQLKIVHLTTNYRSSPNIIQAALQTIAPTSLVPNRALHPIHKEKNKIVLHEAHTDRAEAEFIAHTIEKFMGGSSFFSFDSGRVEDESEKAYSFSDFAVLYRTETQADLLVEALHRSGIPFQKYSHRPLLEEPEIQSFFATLENNDSKKTIYKCLQESLNNAESASPPSTLLRALLPYAETWGVNKEVFQKELSLHSSCDLWDPRADYVSLLTLHASKGLEFPVVFIPGCEDGILPLTWGEKKDADIAEERRLFFVGMTRAQDHLYLCHAKKRLWRGKIRQHLPSPFLQDMEALLLERQKHAFAKKSFPSAEQLALFSD